MHNLCRSIAYPIDVVEEFFSAFGRFRQHRDRLECVGTRLAAGVVNELDELADRAALDRRVLAASLEAFTRRIL